MNLFLKNIAYAGALSAMCISAAYAKSWTLTPQSSVGFSINSLGLNVVKGNFQEFKATMHFDPDRPQQSSTEFTMQVDSLEVSKPSLKNMIMVRICFMHRAIKQSISKVPSLSQMVRIVIRSWVNSL